MTDREIYIATAPSRTTAKWRNKKTTWSALRERCMQEHYTHETLAEYKAMPKAQQSNIKDVGGFVGGYLKNGRRSKGFVEFRDVLCLDIDYGVNDVWDGFTMAFDCASFCYSTHNHTPSTPRIRLVLLLSRSVTPEEYEAIGRAVAFRVGIDYFDDTTYEAERLMYWPSTPKDQTPYHEYQDGPALDPDALLAETYHDWRDASCWKYSRREVEKVRHESAKQGEPTTKPGIVGAFCRCYDIHGAIQEFLPNVYAPAGENRYTYTPGTVAAGLVVYEDGKFAYSHNNTDPCSQHLVNAFDLVRMHLYAELDENTDPKVAINLRPSFKRMAELASSNSLVRKSLIDERMASAVSDFAYLGDDTPQTQDEDDESWKDYLKLDKKNHLLNTIENAAVILTYAPEFRGKLWHDDFSGMERYDGKMPWHRGRVDGIWSNVDFACLRKHLEHYNITGKERIRDAFYSVTNARKRHPIREYLRSLTWDGVPRLDTLFIDFLGAEDSELTRQQTRLQFKGAVARVMGPGCKYDNFMVLVGKEGIGKSTLLSKMGGEWFNDSVTTFEGKEGMEGLRGAWILEIGELIGVKRSSAEDAKSYITRQVDEYRPAYAEIKERIPRQCIFFGTTNEDKFLKGLYGNRRYWIIETGSTQPSMSVFDDLTPDYRDQLWAEATRVYDDDPGDAYHKELCLDPALEQTARQKQADFNELTGDDRVGIIQSYLDILLPADWDTYSIERRRAYFRSSDPLSADGCIQRTRVSAVEIASECLGMPIDDKIRYKTREVNALMRQIPGWELGGRVKQPFYGPQRVYKRIETPHTEEKL